MADFQMTESVRLKSEVKILGNFVDPTTVKVCVAKPDESEGLPFTDMDKSDVGKYFYDYMIPAMKGLYAYSVKAVGPGGRVTIKKGFFLVDKVVGYE